MRVVLCFFGLLKNLSNEQVQAYRHFVIEPFRSRGIQVVAMMHTHKLSVFTNARNLEMNVRVDQKTSFSKVRRLCPWMIMMRTEPVDPSPAHLDLLLRNGDAWRDNPRESLKMFLRQLDSLGHAARGLDVHGREDDLVIMLRPDVLFLEPLNAEAILQQYHANPTMIQTPTWSAYGGVNDRLAIGNRRVLVPYLLRGQRLMEYVEAGHNPHAERFLNFAVPNTLACITTKFIRIRADGRRHPNGRN